MEGFPGHVLKKSTKTLNVSVSVGLSGLSERGILPSLMFSVFVRFFFLPSCTFFIFYFFKATPNANDPCEGNHDSKQLSCSGSH